MSTRTFVIRVADDFVMAGGEEYEKAVWSVKDGVLTFEGDRVCYIAVTKGTVEEREGIEDGYVQTRTRKKFRWFGPVVTEEFIPQYTLCRLKLRSHEVIQTSVWEIRRYLTPEALR